MKNLNDPSLAPHRLKHPTLGEGDEKGGFFFMAGMAVIAANGEGWDHVSVSRKNRCPTWEEMCFIKDKFFEESECVIQYHPPKADYINKHNFVLHLWRPHNEVIPMPPKWMV